MKHLESSVTREIIVGIERGDGVLDVAAVPASSIALGMLHCSRDVRAARDALTMKRLALASVGLDQ